MANLPTIADQILKVPDLTGIISLCLAIGSYALYLLKPNLKITEVSIANKRLKVTITNYRKYFDANDVHCDIVTSNDAEFKLVKTVPLLKSQAPFIKKGKGFYTFVSAMSKRKIPPMSRHVRIAVTGSNPIGVRKVFEVRGEIKGNLVSITPNDKNVRMKAIDSKSRLSE